MNITPLDRIHHCLASKTLVLQALDHTRGPLDEGPSLGFLQCGDRTVQWHRFRKGALCFRELSLFPEESQEAIVDKRRDRVESRGERLLDYQFLLNQLNKGAMADDAK